jgi:hypothetical protein
MKLTTMTIAALVALAFASQSGNAKEPQKFKKFAEENVDFVWVGKCADGTPYRLALEQYDVHGTMKPMYDFEGPLGKGSTQSSVEPRVAKEFVCKEGGRGSWYADGPNGE